MQILHLKRNGNKYEILGWHSLTWNKTLATGIGAAAGVAAGVIFKETLGKAAIKAGTAFAEAVGEGVELIIDKATEAIKVMVFDNIEYVIELVTMANYRKYQDGKIYLAGIAAKDGNVYLSTIDVTHTVAVWFMRIPPLTMQTRLQGVGTYTFQNEKAKQIAYDAGGGEPEQGKPHGTSTATKLFFKHWHGLKHKGHAFWGNPV